MWSHQRQRHCEGNVRATRARARTRNHASSGVAPNDHFDHHANILSARTPHASSPLCTTATTALPPTSLHTFPARSDLLHISLLPSPLLPHILLLHPPLNPPQEHSIDSCRACCSACCRASCSASCRASSCRASSCASCRRAPSHE